MRRLLIVPLCLVAGCQGPPTRVVQDAPEQEGSVDAGNAAADAGAPDAVIIPPDPVDLFGPSFVFDDIHIAAFSEEQNAFSLLGMALNPQLEQQIADGTYLVGMSLMELDDVAGQQDDAVSVAMFTVLDTDTDPNDNFDPAAPEQFTVAEGGLLPGDIPSTLYTDGAIASGELFATGQPLIQVLGLFMAVRDGEVQGTLIPSEDGSYIAELVDGRVRGVLGGALLAYVPNPAEGTCAGGTMLDVLVTGCGYLSMQPDVDIDDDGLERYVDTDGDGSIDVCFDGDGTRIEGTDCPTNPAMADGYSLVWAVHGVRAHIDGTVTAPPAN